MRASSASRTGTCSESPTLNKADPPGRAHLPGLIAQVVPSPCLGFLLLALVLAHDGDRSLHDTRDLCCALLCRAVLGAGCHSWLPWADGQVPTRITLIKASSDTIAGMSGIYGLGGVTALHGLEPKASTFEARC